MGKTVSSAEPHLVFLVTDAVTARVLMRGQLRFLSESGLRVTVVAGNAVGLEQLSLREGAACRCVPMRREPAPSVDLLALVRLIRLLRELRPDVINASTPKAALLGLLAAKLLGVEVRVYTLRGLRLDTLSGWRRRAFWWLERLTASLAQEVVAVSGSLRQRYLDLGLAGASKVIVLGGGSSNGVDVDRFGPESNELGVLLREGSPTIGFVGRLTRDKGVEDLAAVFFDHVLPRYPSARLILVGEVEQGDPILEDVRRKLQESDHVTITGWVEDVAPYYSLFDVLVFPSRREGFPNVPLEAASSGVPVVGYQAIGTVDAVVDGVTGRLVATGDRDCLAEVTLELLCSEDQRRQLGHQARERVVALFQREQVWQAWLAEYRRLLGLEDGSSLADREQG